MTALSTKWPHKTPILIDPSKKTGIFVLLTAAAVAAVFAFKGNDIVSHFVTAHNQEVLRPQMAHLAAEGKPEAVAWMVRNDPAFRSDMHFEALKAAAEKGNPQSMFLYAQVLKYQKNQQGADEYIARAAAEGYPDAVLTQSKDALK
jgi:TPR repeat protein